LNGTGEGDLLGEPVELAGESMQPPASLFAFGVACRLSGKTGDDLFRLSQRVAYLCVGRNAALAQILAKLLSQSGDAGALCLDILPLLNDSVTDDADGKGATYDDGQKRQLGSFHLLTLNPSMYPVTATMIGVITMSTLVSCSTKLAMATVVHTIETRIATNAIRRALAATSGSIAAKSKCGEEARQVRQGESGCPSVESSEHVIVLTYRLRVRRRLVA